MAEQVQSILERMVPYLKDLRQRSIFTPTEITSIVERRRKSEYLLHRRSSSNISDYIRYIEDEILLEKLRKLRKEKMIVELKNERQRLRNEEGGQYKAAYKTSGPGDSHIISHIHFLYQRTLRKFHYPIDILLNYVEFAKSVKSFQMLSRIYAEGIQHHPRTVGLWIEASNFEYFGYVAQDIDNQKTTGGVQGGEDGVSTKIVGSSINNARVLMQRGLRINSNSEELWLQYFTLELHYVQKLRGRKEILELGKLLNDDDEREIKMDGGDDNNDEEGEDNADDNKNKEEEEEEEAIQWEKNALSLIPSQVIYKNAIKAIPTNIQFRLKFVEICRQFPLTQLLESYIMESVTKDFGSSVEGWVARISYAEEMMMDKGNSGGGGGEGVVGGGVLGMDNEDGSDVDDDNEGKRPTKKARVELVEANTSSSGNDPALDLLQEALETVPTSKMYVEGARFLRMRIQHLLNHHGEENSEDDDEEEEEEYDVSHIIGKDEDSNAAAQRHIQLLEKLYEDATKKDISSTTLTLDHVDYLLSMDQQLVNAEKLLSTTVTTDADVRLWLRWAEVSTQVIQDGKEPTASPIQILRRALNGTPLHDRHAYTLVLTELMQHLMNAKPSTSKTNDELKSLFQKLVLLSQGSDYSLSKVKKGDGEDADEEAEDDAVNVAASFLAYLKYSILNDTNNDENENEIRSIYTSVLYHSNYGKTCSGKTDDELLTMKSFFDTCIQYEKEGSVKKLNSASTKKDRKAKKKAKKMKLCKLYEAGIAFYESCGGGNSVWRNVVDGYTRDLNDIKYSF